MEIFPLSVTFCKSQCIPPFVNPYLSDNRFKESPNSRLFFGRSVAACWHGDGEVARVMPPARCSTHIDGSERYGGKPGLQKGRSDCRASTRQIPGQVLCCLVHPEAYVIMGF